VRENIVGLLEKWVESLDYQYEVLTSCTRCKSPRATCQKCIEVCEYKAISLEDNHPVIQRETCNECGSCLAACPVQAIAGIFPKRTVMKNRLIISNEHLPSVKEMLVLYKKGVREIINEDSSQIDPLLNIIEEANFMLSQLGEGHLSLSTTTKLTEKNEEVYSRRELLSLWKKESQSVMKQAAPAKWRFNHQQLDVTKYFPDYQFTTISLNAETCTLCKACEVLCEKQCFNITDDCLTINLQACSSCNLCEDICPEKALHVKEQISSVKKEHYPIYIQYCSTCQKPFSTLNEQENQCVSCKKRKGFWDAGTGPSSQKNKGDGPLVPIRIRK